MNKTAIKNFAVWARNKLIADISYRAGLMGITEDGIHKALPQSTGTTEFYDIGTAEPYSINGDAVKQRNHLVELIQRKEKETNYKTAYKYVLEEVAYTWFNRLIAVRFMEVNDYLPSHIRVLSSDSGKMEPDLVTTPFDAELSFTPDEEQLVYQLKQENKIDELFRILFIKQCNALNESLPALFEKTSDYTELLLNLSVIDQDSVVYHLVHDIPEEDFDVERGGQVEIIGWLFQYYNTEPKDEVFALLKKNVKVNKDRIPAATQIFTPDWIVRYMVENSLGRLWQDGHRNSDLKDGWKYYLEEAEQEQEVEVKLTEIRAEYAKLNPEDIKVIDPCMGSGHILVYAFDVLMQIYESAGYGQRDAARSILENNLYGLDIDDRAFQMAYFAIMMKARQYNRRILNDRLKPNLCSITESNTINREQLKYFGRRLSDSDLLKASSQINRLLDEFEDAKEYGSILKIQQYDWSLLKSFVSDAEIRGQLSFDVVGIDETQDLLTTLVVQGEMLSQEYSIVITNPPYMGSSNMDSKLLAYTKKNYPVSKADISTVFIEKMLDLANANGFISLINIPSWMSLMSFAGLRETLIDNAMFINMAHMGRGIFGADFGTTSFVLAKCHIDGYKARFKRLFRKSSLVDTIEEKESKFLSGVGDYYAKQDNFKKMKGAPIAYWINENTLDIFQNATVVDDLGTPRQGFASGDNNKFFRLWNEVQFSKIGIGVKSTDEIDSQGLLYVPHNKGGEYRKWYGNISYVVKFDSQNREVLASQGNHLPSRAFYFKTGFTWSDLTIGDFAARYIDCGATFDTCGPTFFSNSESLDDVRYVLGYFNSKVFDHIVKIYCSGIHYSNGVIATLPCLVDENIREAVIRLVEENIEISKKDWNDRETSWGFNCHPLTRESKTTIKAAFEWWSQATQERFEKVRQNEKKINELFVSAYGLEQEIETDVDENFVTIEKANKKKDITSLLSYAVGCMFGRYSLDHNGLAYAGGEWDDGTYSIFVPDKDNIIPITDEEYLEDDVVARLCNWLKVVYGEQTLEENLDFIADALGNKGNSSREIIRNYFLNDFFKDHCQAYSVTGSGKRPIYWFFDSGKQNGFKALIYLHRYNADTIGNLRIDYLHRMQRIYESEISRMQDMIDHSTSGREVAQATKRREKLTKQLKECREYDEKLAHLALSRIELDLDDGVKKNYRKIQTANDGKFYEVLADSKNIMSKE